MNSAYHELLAGLASSDEEGKRHALKLMFDYCEALEKNFTGGHSIHQINYSKDDSHP